MNITDRLAASLFEPRCVRCGAKQGDKRGWRKNRVTNEWDIHVITHRLCPACVVDYDWFLATPPENPDTDSVSSTDVPKGAT